MKQDVADRATEFRISAASKDGYLAFVYLGFSIRMLINDLSYDCILQRYPLQYWSSSCLMRCSSCSFSRFSCRILLSILPAKSAAVIEEAARHCDNESSMQYVHLAQKTVQSETEDAFN